MSSSNPENSVRATPVRPGVIATLRRWFDTSDPGELGDDADRIDWLRTAPFIGIHLACLGVIWVGVSAFAVWTAVALYALRMFAITGFYHRYFSHRAFKTSRATQFVFACIGAMCVQRGPLWWAAHHRNHHRHSDKPGDLHSPRQHGFLWAHMGWFLTPRGFRTDWDSIPDWKKFPELRWLDRYDILLPILLAVGLFSLGGWLETAYPQLGTTGPQLLVWGFFVSTVVLFHATVTINSLAHQFGSRRYDTRDDSRNNLWLALITLGEGWHNNHHHFPGSARQGFRWWEVDVTWYLLKAMQAVGLVHDLRPVPVGLRRPLPLTEPRDVLINPAQASRIGLPASQGASAKEDWPSDETAQRGTAGRQMVPNSLICKDGVMDERSSDRRARLAQAASLHGATHPNLRTFRTSCRLRGVDQSIPN